MSTLEESDGSLEKLLLLKRYVTAMMLFQFSQF